MNDQRKFTCRVYDADGLSVGEPVDCRIFRPQIGEVILLDSPFGAFRVEQVVQSVPPRAGVELHVFVSLTTKAYRL